MPTSCAATTKDNEMNTTVFTKALERLLRSVDEVIATHSQDDAPDAEARRNRAEDLCHERLNSMEDVWVRSSAGGSASQGDATVAAALVRAQLEAKMFMRLEVVFITLREQAAVAQSAPSAAARRHALATIYFAGEAAFLLLQRACSTAARVKQAGRSKNDRAVGQEAISIMAQRGFMLAAANAAWGVLAAAALLRAHVAEVQDAWTGRYDLLVAEMAEGLCIYTDTMAQLATAELGGVGSAAQAVPPAAAQTVQAMVGSELVAAAAAAVLDSCPRKPWRQGAHVQLIVRSAVDTLLQALMCNCLLRAKLLHTGGSEGRRLAAGLLRASRHVAVRQLQVGLLDQLAVHAGLGPQLLQQEQVEGEQEKGQQQQGSVRQGQDRELADGWVGSSGTWWFACEEARQGQLLGRNLVEASTSGCDRRRSRTAGWLEERHCFIVEVTLGEWRMADSQLAAEAGVPAAPPPLLRARLAARTAEALCRLCRGQGLGGAYAPAPEWQLAKATALVSQLVATAREAASLPADTARACLPHWVEAAGWAVALMSDATAAAMGRLPAAERQGAPASFADVLAKRGCSRPATLQLLLDRFTSLAHRNPSGTADLLPAARDDAARRLHRCGLAASLDHTLRLAFSAQDDSALAEEAHDLRMAARASALVLDSGVVPLMAPAAAAASGADDSGCTVQAGGVGSSSSTSSGTAAGGLATRDQLGLVLTLSKRASMLTRGLEAVCASGVEGGAGQGREQLLYWSGVVLEILVRAIHGMYGPVRLRVEQARAQASAAVEASGGDGADAVGQAGEGVCVDEAHEALALAVRACSKLAAPLAWQLAADIGTGAAAAAAEGSPGVVPDVLQRGAAGVRGLLGCMAGCCAHPPLLPSAQLLACQPHRLLAGACALVAALPAGAEQKQGLGAVVADVVVLLAAQPALSSRVRCWLAPLTAATSVYSSRSGGGGGGGDGGSGGGGGSGGDGGASSSTASRDDGGGGSSGEEPGACAGCLAAPVQSAARHTRHLAPGAAMRALALMHVAAGEVVPGAGGCGGVAGEAGGGFQQYATALADMVWSNDGDLRAPGGQVVVLPEGGPQPAELLAGEPGDGGGLPPPPPPPSPPLASLPPPLALQPSRAGALPRLHVCGGPRCSNFGMECEEALPLKQCGGCRAVRYCGPDCQRAHWREGHRAECKAMAAGAAR